MITTAAPRRRSRFPVLEVLGLLMLLATTVLLVTQLSGFSAERQHLPYGLILGEVPVSGLSLAEAKASVEQVYGNPVTIYYLDQEIHLYPDQVAFRVDSDGMLSRADELRTEGTFWSGFWDYLWRRPEQAYHVDLIASYSPELLLAWVSDLATRYDHPPEPAAIRLDTLSVEPGRPGYTLDQEDAVEKIDGVLFQPVSRVVELTAIEQGAPEPTIDTLKELLIEYLANSGFEGVVSMYVIDESNGDSLQINLDLRQGSPLPVNCDIAYAGLSTMKIPLMVEYYRYLAWEPYNYEFDVVLKTMTESSNLNANFMLRDIGGDSISRGTQVFNASIQEYLGLENTFMVAPYDEEDPPQYRYSPAREAAANGTCINTNPDPYMQTTAEDLAMLMDMIYQCAEYGGGGLVAAYPEDITQSECQTMLEVMALNDEGPLIMSGVPVYVEVPHKHGYTYDTISDAGVVLSPGGDYVMVIFLWQDVSWVAPLAFPVMEGLSHATFNYFNPDLIAEPRRGYADVINPEG
nr:serine hydrolase [Anaerolineae bacterium]